MLLLRDLRGRPTFRSFTASRSFGSISHTFPSFVAFKRLAAIILCTLLTVTFNRFAAFQPSAMTLRFSDIETSDDVLFWSGLDD